MLYFDPEIVVEIILNGEKVEEAKKLYEKAVNTDNLVVYDIHLGLVLAKLEKKHIDYAKTFANSIVKLNIKQKIVDIKKLVEIWAQEKKSFEEVLLEFARKEGYDLLTLRNLD